MAEKHDTLTIEFRQGGYIDITESVTGMSITILDEDIPFVIASLNKRLALNEAKGRRRWEEQQLESWNQEMAS